MVVVVTFLGGIREEISVFVKEVSVSCIFYVKIDTYSKDGSLLTLCHLHTSHFTGSMYLKQAILIKLVNLPFLCFERAH